MASYIRCMAAAERARRVLAVAESAAGQIKAEQPSGERWVILWTASVALLCTVDDALGRDKRRSTGLDAAIRLSRRQRRIQDSRDEVYWGFIRNARNSILHEFELMAGQGVVIAPGLGHRVIYELHSDGYPDLAGLNQIELLERACSWWHRQLDDIETRAAVVEARLHPSKRQLP